MERQYILLASGLAILQVLDLTTTLIGFQLGDIETNFLAVHTAVIEMIIIKSLFVGVIFAFTYAVSKLQVRPARLAISAGLIGLGLWYVFIVSKNVMVLAH